MCKYATEFIESIILASDDTVVLSMGPSLSRSCDSIFTSVDALTGPSVDVRDDFFNRDKPLALDFQPEPPADVVCAVSEMSVAQSSTSNMVFITIDRAGVNRLELVNKQKAKMSGVFGVSLLPVLQRSRPDLRVGLERVDGQALDECHLLTPGMVSMDDLQTMRVWKCLRLQYGVGYLLPTHLIEASQKALEALLHARRLQGGKLVLSHADQDGSDARRTRVREALEALEQLGMVSCSSKQSRSSTWSFTSTGEKSIAVSVWIGQPVQALTRRQGVAIRDLMLFELLDVLQERCWTCQCPAARAPRASLAYTVGSEKICWLRPSTKSITLKYLLALLDAEPTLLPNLVFNPQDKKRNRPPLS